jgi:hypothetical protein
MRRVTQVVLCLAVAACQPTGGPSQLGLRFERIVLKQHSGFGPSAAYAISLADDGAVTFVGHQYVAASSGTTRLTHERMVMLENALSSAGFYGLMDHYGNQNTPCEPMATDAPWTKLTLEIHGKKSALSLPDNCWNNQVVDDFAYAKATIEYFTGASQWIHGTFQPAKSPSLSRP